MFTSDAEREGAYDLLENDQVDAEEIEAGLARVSARHAAEHAFVFVPVDGTSVTVTDRTGKKGMGSVGTLAQAGRGLKAIDALGIDPRGTPVGLLGLTWWCRTGSAPTKVYARQTRPLEEKETLHWVRTVEKARAALDEAGARGWFLIDREGDSSDLLSALAQTQHWWTVRSNRDRNLEIEGGEPSKLRRELGQQGLSGLYTLSVPARLGRAAREATMLVRVCKVVLRFRDKKTGRTTPFPVTAVWALEHGSTPEGKDPIDWLLFTNRSVETLDDALFVVWGYSLRWRIEEFHRTWKAGECDVESSQLESPAALQRWGTILAAVAVRIERLKRLARTTPNAPADIELSPLEVRALKMLKFGDEPPDGPVGIAQAVAWLAELGGFANKYSGRPPGATVLGRGLRHLRPAARILELQQRYER